MRQSSSKGRSIVERKLWSSFRLLQTSLKRVDLSPECQDLLLFLWEVERGRDWRSTIRSLINLLEEWDLLS